MNPYIIIASIGLFVSTAYGLYYHGYKTAENEYRLVALQAEKRYNTGIKKVQDELYETERAWLEEEAKKEVVYRDRIKTVTKTIEKYVTDNDLSRCNVGVDGLRAINEAIRGTEGKDK